MSNKKLVITICGPSTTGKSTLADLFKLEGYKSVVTTTTRPSRTGEVDGINYYFSDAERFEQMKQYELLEHSPVGKYQYGVSKKAINDALSAGVPVILVMEPLGANKVAEFCAEQGIENHKVYINNTLDVLIERLIIRKEHDANANEEVYKDRLYNLVFKEPKEWTEPAYNKTHYYDQIFDTFILENQQEVYQNILTAIDNRLNINNTSETNSKRKP